MDYSVVCAYHIQMRFLVIFFMFIHRSVEHFVLAQKLVPHSTIREDYALLFIFFIQITCGFSMESSICIMGLNGHNKPDLEIDSDNNYSYSNF